METATLGGGCFWCFDAVFARINGVSSVLSGYAGGVTPSPTYPQVCTGTTGHAEVVQMTFLPEIIPFDEILKVFFALHDPTTQNCQGADIGTQYRSVIFYHTEIQKETAYRVIHEIEAAKIVNDPIVTEVVPMERFYPAEAYHQRYYKKNPNHGYCRAVIAPKMEKLQKRFHKRLKPHSSF